TPLQKACGFEDDPEEMYKYLIASCGPGADAEKIRLYCERSVEHYHWITGRGVPFKQSFLPVEVGTDPYTDDGLSYTGSELAWPFCEIAKPAPRGRPAPQGSASRTRRASGPAPSAGSRSRRRAGTPRSRSARTRASS